MKLKYLIPAIVALLSVMLTSCEDRQGYYDTGQIDRIKTLTSVNWTQHNSWTDPGNINIDGYEIWSFDSTGKGSCTMRREKDGTVIEKNTYSFLWTFTNDNFAVIYMVRQSFGESFWLIDKLTISELCVYEASQDPVIYPGTTQNYEKYIAAPK